MYIPADGLLSDSSESDGVGRRLGTTELGVVIDMLDAFVDEQNDDHDMLGDMLAS